ncbi:hypothetical protein OAU52_00640 [bacterium]|nr:hypothetical protein [bacterium]
MGQWEVLFVLLIPALLLFGIKSFKMDQSYYRRKDVRRIREYLDKKSKTIRELESKDG